MIDKNTIASSSRAVLTTLGADVCAGIRYLDARASDQDAENVIDWLVYLRISRGLTESTITTYAKNLARFFEWMAIDEIRIDELNVSHIDNWQKWMYVSRRFGSQFRLQHITAVRQYFSWRETYGGHPNPAKNVRGPKITKRVPKKYSTTELQRLFSTCDLDTDIGIRDYAILLFLYSTGARRMECQQLTLEQLTLSENVGTVKFLGKGSKEREVSFQGEAVDAMRNWLTVRDRVSGASDGHVWVSVDGKGKSSSCLSLSRLVRMVQERAKRAKITNSGMHMMRVTFATDLYDDGIDIEIIQELMGHEKIETTRRYIVISERRRKTRMSNNRINIVTGRKNRGIPLWARKKAEAGSVKFDD